MKKSATITFGLLFSLFSITQTVHANPINLVTNWSPTSTITSYFFTEFGLTPANPILIEDGILDGTGISFAEHFSGQTVTMDSVADGSVITTYDVLSGTPNGPLALEPGSAGHNMALDMPVAGSAAGLGLLSGLGPLSEWPDQVTTGTGSVAMLFDVDQAGVGIMPWGTGNTSGPNTGMAWVDFFRRDGSLIDSLLLSNFSDITYRFARESSVADIAGLSIYTSDTYGNAYLQLEFSQETVSAVPIPPAHLLLGSGLLGLAGIARRRKTV